MTEHADSPERGRRAWTRLFTPLTLVTCLGVAAASHADTQNTVLYVRATPALTRGAVSYDIGLYSSVEFPMRDEVATLTIGDKSFINSSYLQGGDLHTIVFSLTQSQFQMLRNGDPMVVYYGQGDASDPAAQWHFGTFQGLTATKVKGGGVPLLPVGTPVQVTDTPVQAVGGSLSDSPTSGVTKFSAKKATAVGKPARTSVTKKATAPAKRSSK